ncbi:MAG: hypothetical protein NWE80_02110 [Candidatus Bathyarchaeota archaeon]|nr:hypothetical protein [Candidatus Bathyarchaeota archaeon]
MNEHWNEISDLEFSERDTNVLHIIDEEDLSSFTFEGLKRRLDMHPETLSRVLYRLADEGILEKGVEGYTVTSKARELLKSHSLASRVPAVCLLQTLLPPDVPIQFVVSKLKGKWFGMLRWLGSSESREGIVLKWITEDGGIIISAIFSHGQLNIDAKMLLEKDLNVALKASYQLMGYITNLISKVEGKRMAYLDHFDSNRLSA